VGQRLVLPSGRTGRTLSRLAFSQPLKDGFAMPIYEFHCGKCRRDSELLVRSINWEGAACPHCGSQKLTKKLSVFASAGGSEANAPTCTGTPSSCGMCGTGRPHSH
jgi:putative FmdB family regulatory protein